MKIVRLLMPAAALLAAIAVAGCGSSGSSSSQTAAQSSPGGAGPYGAVVHTTSSTTAAAMRAASHSVLVTVKTEKKLGSILAAGRKRMTVYVYQADRGGKSACTGACAAAWPPVTGTGRALAGALPADLGTITRADGTKQVTYKGHPLYFFVKDKDDGDAYGQGVKAFGASWYVLKPNGSKLDES